MDEKFWIVVISLFLSGAFVSGCMESDSSSGNSAPIAADAPAENGGTVTEGSVDEVLDRNLGWRLVRWVEDGNEQALPPSSEFIMRFHALPGDPNVACAGSCPREFRLSGHGYCGALRGEFTRGFDEFSGENFNNFGDVRTEAPRGCERAQVDARILETMDESRVDLQYEEAQELLYIQDGSKILVFEAYGA